MKSVRLGIPHPPPVPARAPQRLDDLTCGEVLEEALRHPGRSANPTTRGARPAASLRASVGARGRLEARAAAPGSCARRELLRGHRGDVPRRGGARGARARRPRTGPPPATASRLDHRARGEVAEPLVVARDEDRHDRRHVEQRRRPPRGASGCARRWRAARRARRRPSRRAGRARACPACARRRGPRTGRRRRRSRRTGPAPLTIVAADRAERERREDADGDQQRALDREVDQPGARSASRRRARRSSQLDALRRRDRPGVLILHRR